jgi:hypothetical protein
MGGLGSKTFGRMTVDLPMSDEPQVDENTLRTMQELLAAAQAARSNEARQA